MKNKTKEDRFAAKPVRKGKFYCSPWCGFDCLWEHFQNATKKAQELCEKLGPAWEPRVWENTGWHWQAVLVERDNAGDAVFVSGPSQHYDRGNYWCEVNTSNKQFIVHHKSPVKGICLAILEAHRHAKKVLAMTEFVTQSLK